MAPTDGRLTSQPLFTGSLAGSEFIMLVSPGNPSSGINYKMFASTLASFIMPSGGTSLPLVSNGPTANPTFQLLTVPGGGVGTASLGTGVLIGQGASTVITVSPLSVATGGIGTSSLGTGVVIGQNTTAPTTLATTAGYFLQSQGSASAPTFTTLGVVGMATTNPPLGFGEAVNIQINAATSGSALTITLTGNNGAAISATNPLTVAFRDATTANGDPVWRTATAAISLTIPQTATIGGGSAFPLRGWLTLHDTGTAPILGVINCLVGTSSPTQIVALPEYSLQSTIAISNTATSAGVFYGSSAVSSRPFRILGYFEYQNMTTVGQWNGTPTTIQLFGPGLKRPGDEVQRIYQTFNSSTVIVSTAFASTVMSASITPTSAANVVEAAAEAGAVSLVTNDIFFELRRGASTRVSIAGVFAANTQINTIQRAYAPMDMPATTGPVTYAGYAALQNSTTNTGASWPASSYATPIASVFIKEIMA